MTVLGTMWLCPPPELWLSGDEVHVWRASLDQPDSSFRELQLTISTDERIRAERFYFDRDRKRFIVGRGILRMILGRYLGIEPKQLEFRYGSRGKPSLVESSGGGNLRFNLSHSQGLALYAVTREREIGVDLEYLRHVPDAVQIAERFFSIQEKGVIGALPESKRREAFFNCWTRKEAYIKAIGDGLARPLDQFSVTLVPGEPARLLGIEGDPQEVSRWSLQELTPDHDCVAAVAAEGHGLRLVLWQWEVKSRLAADGAMRATPGALNTRFETT